MNVFVYDNVNNRIELNEPEILLVSEFKNLLERDKTKEKKRVFREFTYIYLALDWKSPYNQYAEQERHQESLNDASLTEEEFNDPIFREACRKYKKLQESNTSYQLLQAAENAASKLIDYFNIIVDFNDRKDDGTPIFKAKDVITELSNVSKVHETLKELRAVIQRDLQAKSTLRAGAEEDFDPGDF